VMHAFICVPWWFMYAFICMSRCIYDLMHVCDRTLAHTWQGITVRWPRYAHRVLQCDIFIDAYSFLFLYYVEPAPIDECALYFPHTWVSLYHERTYIFVIMYIYTYTCTSRERWNLWPVTFIHMYFCGACIHTFDMMGHIYLHVFGRDASVSSFLCAIGLYHVC